VSFFETQCIAHHIKDAHIYQESDNKTTNFLSCCSQAISHSQATMTTQQTITHHNTQQNFTNMKYMDPSSQFKAHLQRRVEKAELNVY